MQRVILKLDFRKSVKHMVGVLVICLDGFNAWFGTVVNIGQHI
jgi:hypothetical protein